jgi:hypothetical protein
LRHRKGRRHSSGDSSWAAYFQANNEEFNFWSAEWAAARTSLLRLALLDGLDPTKPAGNASAASAGATAKAKASTSNVSTKVSMLEGLRDSGLALVAGLKAHEQKSKKLFDEQEGKHKDRLAKIDARFAQKALSAEFHTQESKEEGRQWGYWQRSRERQVAQLQTGMKLQEGLMDSAKTLLDAYSQKGSLKLEEAQRSVKAFCHTAWAEVQKQREALEKALPE